MAAGDGLLAGRPVDAIDLRLAADGEIEVSGPHVVTGYLDPADDAATKRRDGGRVWHRTGDGGRLDADGRLWLTGRIAARAGGLEPFRVEIAARSWPGVRAAVLLPVGERRVLAIEGDRRHLPEWRTAAARLGSLAVRPVRRIPMDRRHRSKPDDARHAALLRAAPDTS
jgi:acyl-CoA synthetase (AMP-forming)/AMP-acid ligase II